MNNTEVGIILEFDNSKDFYLEVLKRGNIGEMERDYMEKLVMQLSEEGE